MTKRWIITILVLALVSILLWGRAKWSVADEEYYSRKMMNKLTEILENQGVIIKHLQDLKAELVSEE